MPADKVADAMLAINIIRWKFQPQSMKFSQINFHFQKQLDSYLNFIGFLFNQIQ